MRWGVENADDVTLWGSTVSSKCSRTETVDCGTNGLAAASLLEWAAILPGAKGLDSIDASCSQPETSSLDCVEGQTDTDESQSIQTVKQPHGGQCLN